MRFQKKNQTAKYVIKSVAKTNVFVYIPIHNVGLKINMPLLVVKPGKRKFRWKTLVIDS